MATYVVRSRGTRAYLESPDGFHCVIFRKAHRFATLEEALNIAGRNPTWREVVRVTYKRKVRRIAVLKVVN